MPKGYSAVAKCIYDFTTTNRAGLTVAIYTGALAQQTALLQNTSNPLTAWDPNGVSAVEDAVDAALAAGADPRNSTVQTGIAAAYFALQPSLTNFNAVITASEAAFGGSFDASAVGNGRGLALLELSASGDPTNAQAAIAALFPPAQVSMFTTLLMGRSDAVGGRWFSPLFVS